MRRDYRTGDGGATRRAGTNVACMEKQARPAVGRPARTSFASSGTPPLARKHPLRQLIDRSPSDLPRHSPTCPMLNDRSQSATALDVRAGVNAGCGTFDLAGHLARELALAPDSRLLDVGCGTGAPLLTYA